MKTLNRGLLYMGTPPASFVSQKAVNGAVVQVNWSDVHTATSTFNRSVVDSAIAYSMSTGVSSVRLRIMGGQHAPEFVKQLSGGPLTLIQPSGTGNPNPGASFTVPKWWTSDVYNEKAELLTQLASWYESDSRVLDVTFGVGVTTEFDEWPIRQWGPNAKAYEAAGYAVGLDEQAILTEVNLYHSLFKETRIYYADSLWFDGGGVINPTFTQQVITNSRTYGNAIHGTNNLDGDWLPVTPTASYILTNKLNPISFQCQPASNASNTKLGIQQAITNGANAIEMQGQGSITSGNMTVDDWVTLNAELIKNP